MSDPLHALHAIRAGWERTLRRFGGVVDVAPFLLSFSDTTDLVWLNYGTPIADADEATLADALERCRGEFTTRGRTIRFEWFEALAPTLESIATAAGLSLQAKMPALACTREDLGRVAIAPAELNVTMLDAESDASLFSEFFAVRNAALGPLSDAPLADQIAEQRAELASGNTRSAIVHRDGVPAGVASIVGTGAVAELVGVGTSPEHRNHGVARAASEALARRHLLTDGGDVVWLSAADDTARKVYERIGFRFIGWQLNYVDAAWLKANPPRQ